MSWVYEQGSPHTFVTTKMSSLGTPELFMDLPISSSFLNEDYNMSFLCILNNLATFACSRLACSPVKSSRVNEPKSMLETK